MIPYGGYLRRRLILCISILLLLIPFTLVYGSGEILTENSVTESRDLQDVNISLDGVELTISTPFLPSQQVILPEPGDPVQVVNIVQSEPLFRSLTITAIPFGTKPSVEVFPIAEPDNIQAYRSAISSHRRSQGGKPVNGPTATLFDQEITGIASTVFINIDVFEPKPVRIVEWVVEAGNRIWLLRISQEIQDIAYYLNDLSDRDTTENLTGIQISGTNLNTPSISLDARDSLPSSIASITSVSDLPFPPWWDGDCDKNTYHDQTGIWSYPLGGSYRGVKACGPRPWADGAPNAIVQLFPGSWGVLEWECVELVMRFMYLEHGISPYQANGNQVVTNYSGTKLIKISNGTPGFAPQPNDIMSSGPETAVGHTSVVIDSNVDSAGNGTITILEQNSSTSGIRSRTVTDWEVLGGYTIIGWLHDPSDGDYTPPTGDILEPLGNQDVMTTTVHLEGWASDEDSGLSSAQFIANYVGSWHDIGPGFSEILYSYDWDWCEADVPDGPISLALRLTDNQGNQTTGNPGLRHLVKDYACPSIPKCTPSANQIALFTHLNFQGDCELLNVGDYPDSSSFEDVGNDNTESILIGENVMATIFTETSYQGRRETITENDANLSENQTRSNKLTSLKVMDRNTLPSVPSHQWPSNLSTFSESDSLTLYWTDEGAASQMRASIDGPSLSQTSNWGLDATWNLGSLYPGIYSWRLQARNANGDSAWSTYHFFTIADDAPSLPASTTSPFSDTVEGDISAWYSTGLWHRTDTDSHNSTKSWWYSQAVTQTYDTDATNFGSLTTPPITIPPVQDPYHVEFWSKYDTEGTSGHWDQRWVQVSIDGSIFQNIFQLKDDPPGIWLRTQLDLSPYYAPETTHDLQIRYYFSSVDDAHNDHLGWYIDDVQVEALPSQTCSDLNEDNNSPQNATTLTYGESLEAEICPGTDKDFYTFTGFAGDQIVIDIDAKTAGSNLDSFIQLLDGDGSSILALHDDEIPGIQQDSHLGYQLPGDGTYFIQAQAWDTPMGTGAYTLSLFTDDVVPTLSLVDPTSNAFLPAGEIEIQASAVDNLSGISHVQFLGFAGGWDTIGEDWVGADGWGIPFDTSGMTEGDQIDFYTRAYDWAGNWTGTASWDLTMDFTHPDTTADPLSSSSESTAIHLNWSHTDNLAGIRSSHIRYRVNSEAWINQGFDQDTRDWWFIGEAGNNYTFRIRAIDDAGNIEPYLEGAQLSTTIPAMSTLCASPDTWDISASVNDNSPVSAIPLPTSWQTHNFCNPETTDRLFDTDWFTFAAESDQIYTIKAVPTNESTAVVIRLFDSDGTTMLAERSPSTLGEPTTLIWDSTHERTVYIELSHLDGRIAGDAVAYQVTHEANLNGSRQYLPIIQK